MNLRAFFLSLLLIIDHIIISLFNDENKFSMLLFFFTEKTPGPAAYSPRLDNSKLMSPAFTIRSLRREKSHVLGPFATF